MASFDVPTLRTGTTFCINTPSSQPSARGPIDIVAVLHEEINELLTWLSDVQCIHIGGQDFWTSRLDGHAMAMVLSRIGKATVAFTTAVLITQFNVYAAAFAGVVGTLTLNVAVDNVAVPEELLQHDVDTSPLFLHWEIPLIDIVYFPADAALASGPLESASAVLADPYAPFGPGVMRTFRIIASQAHRGPIVSGDHFVCASAGSTVLRAVLPDALAIEMEGTAVMQVCHEWGVLFIATHTVSDRTSDAASVDFVQFITQVDSRYAAAILRGWLSMAVGA